LAMAFWFSSMRSTGLESSRKIGCPLGIKHGYKSTSEN
jgi:hypothetical protein